MATYANINPSSKYYDTQHQTQPFKVTLADSTDTYIWHGNGNHYRTDDLDFYVKGKDNQFYKHGLIRLDFPLTARCLESLIGYAKEMNKSEDISDREHIYGWRDSKIKRLCEEFLAVIPKERPKCNRCGKIRAFCEDGCQ